MRNSRYNLIHALLASGILIVGVCANGLGNFWHQFIYGLSQPLTPQAWRAGLINQCSFFGLLIVSLWLSTYMPTVPGLPKRAAPSASTPPRRRKAVLFALKIALPVGLVALGLNILGAHVIEWISGVRPADQELVKFFTDSSYPFWLRLFMTFDVVVLAPLLEESLFRGIIFRGFARKMPLVLAMALSGFIFAIVHDNAASLFALWYLGVAFALLYARTRTILAPMTLHCLFNVTNLVLLSCFPNLNI